MSYYFTIIGTKDNPLYEFEFSSFKSSITSNIVSSSSPSLSFPGQSQFHNQIKEILPFVTHSSLDIIEDVSWATNQFSLGRIDSFYGLVINAFITQGNIKLILCVDTGAASSSTSTSGNANSSNGGNSTHSIGASSSIPHLGSSSASAGASATISKSDDNLIKQFFMEVNDLYVKCLLNPLYAVNEPITSPDFDFKVKQLARKYL